MKSIRRTCGTIHPFITVLGGLFLAASANAGITFTPIDASTAYCPHSIPGWTKTSTMYFNNAGNESVANDVDILNSSVHSQFSHYWSFVENTSLIGNLQTLIYLPYDEDGEVSDACQHGARIEMQLLDGYIGLAPGQHIGWMQMYDNPGAANVVDPPLGYQIPTEGSTNTTPSDEWPFYNQPPGTDDLDFFDSPADSFLIPDSPHNGYSYFRTFLTSWDGVYDGNFFFPEVVNVYGEVTWGFSYLCVPEPSTVSLVVVGAAIVLFRHRRAKR